MKDLIKKILKEELELKNYPKSKAGWSLSQLQRFKEKLPNIPNYILMDMFGKKNEKPYSDKEIDLIVKEFSPYKWKLVKDMSINMDTFTDDTIKRIKERKGGSLNPYGVPNDSKRHEYQKSQIKEKGLPTEPIVLFKVGDKYDLIEGWHRTIQLLNKYPNGYIYPNVYVGYK